MEKALIILLIVIVVAGIVGYVYINSIKTTGLSISDIEKKTENKISTGKIKEFEIIAKQWEFVPNIIEVNQGDLVRLKIKSIDVTHGMAIPEFGISETLKPGKDIEVEFVADKKGEFGFFCSLYCGTEHLEMKGKLIVR